MQTPIRIDKWQNIFLCCTWLSSNLISPSFRDWPLLSKRTFTGPQRALLFATKTTIATTLVRHGKRKRNNVTLCMVFILTLDTESPSKEWKVTSTAWSVYLIKKGGTVEIKSAIPVCCLTHNWWRIEQEQQLKYGHSRERNVMYVV